MRLCKLFGCAVSVVLILGSPARLGDEHGESPDTDLGNVNQLISNHTSDETTDSSIHSQVTGTTDSSDVVDPFTSHITPPNVWQIKLPRLFCNFDVSSQFRDGPARFMVDQIDASFCTDLNYDHEELQEYHFQSVTRTNVLPHERNLSLPPCKAINDHKVKHPNLKTYLTLSESDEITFSDIVENSHRKRQFLISCPFNLRLWGFDGLILRWVYPPQPEYLTGLLEELRNSFFLDYRNQKKERQRLLLGVIVTGETGGAASWYEVDAVSDLVDFIVLQLFDSDPPALPNVTSLVTYLYKPQKDNDDKIEAINNITDVNASGITEASGNFSPWQQPNPLTHQTNNYLNPNEILPREIRASVSADGSNAYSGDGSEEALETDKLTSQIVASLSKPKVFYIDETITEWTLHGADKSKLIIGISLTGQLYHLLNSTQNGIGAPTIGDTEEIYFYDTCNLTRQGGVRTASASDKTPYWSNGTDWISFEDMTSIAQKVLYLEHIHVSGLMLFSLSEDDFSGTHCGLGTFPVARMVYNVSKAYLATLVVGTYEWEPFCGQASGSFNMTLRKLVLLLFVKYLV